MIIKTVFILSTLFVLIHSFSFGIGMKESKCFFDTIEEGSMVEGHYTSKPEAQGRRLQLSIIGPDGSIIIKTLESSQSFAFTAFKDGSHQFCFSDIATSTQVTHQGDRIVNVNYHVEHPHVHARIEEESIDDLSLSLLTIESQLSILAEDYFNRKTGMDGMNVDLAQLNSVMNAFSILSIGFTGILGLYKVKFTIQHLKKIKVIM